MFRTRDKYSGRFKDGTVSIQRSKIPAEDDREDDGDAEVDDYVERHLYLEPQFGHRVLVIQPYIKWGRKKETLTTPQLQLREAETLVKTLRTWSVVRTKLVPVLTWNTKRLFGSGQLEDLRGFISQHREITAVFVSINNLHPVQQLSLQEDLGLPVFDRYTIVINIFREHATSREAKLQIKLAELPYLWSRMGGIREGSLLHFGGEASSDIGSTWKGKELSTKILRRREAKIKDEIEKLKEHRSLIRKVRIQNEVPTVAVVGYTNAGKTSLIKTLTGKQTLEPQDYLFATLDITVHKGVLPSSLEVFYIDTIGFMSNIPSSLFDAFVATLEDVKLADVVIHIRDVSHPDTIAQNANVLNTLRVLGLSQDTKQNIITVGNKIDLVDGDSIKRFRDEGLVLISAKDAIGTGILERRVEEMILDVTNRRIMIMKVRTGRDEYIWLHENTTIVDETPFPQDNSYALLKVIITETSLAIFKHTFINDYYKTRKEFAKW